MGGEWLLPIFVIATPIASLACFLLYLSGLTAGLPNPVRLAILPLAVLFFIYFGQMFWSVTIIGNHNCGPEFNDYLSGRGDFERFIPLGYLLFVTLAVFLTLRPYLNEDAA